MKAIDFIKFGGKFASKVSAGTEGVTVIAETSSGAMKAHQAAGLASGIRLRTYRFDRYKTKKKDDDNAPLKAQFSVAVADVAAAKKAFTPENHIVDGVLLARELVNEPPNVLYPVEFARRASGLRKLGVQVDVLDVAA